MTSYFPDVNVWLAVVVQDHSHNKPAFEWIRSVKDDDLLIFSRFTQMGLLRLLTNQAAMGAQTLSLGQAWNAFDECMGDSRIHFHPEPYGVDAAFRQVTAPLAKLSASKAVGDSFLIAFAQQSGATLVTFDKALWTQARKAACAAMIPR
ncbi:MAG: TA system VapC family ribonuclease toxin [Acidobacteriota bacterium]